MKREEMMKALREGVCSVKFTKVNGEERLMDCTLLNGMIPENMQPKTEDNKEPNLEVIRVYDVKAEGWRSFRVENVSEFASQA